MSDKIREAFEKWCDDYFSGDEYDIQMSESAFEHGYHAGSTSRDTEISELVEALRTAYFVGTDPDIISKIDFKDLVCRYTKTPCPECVGTGFVLCDNPDHGFLEAMIWHDIGRLGCPVCGHDPEHKTDEPCPTCKGSGKVWRKR